MSTICWVVLFLNYTIQCIYFDINLFSLIKTAMKFQKETTNESMEVDDIDSSSCRAVVMSIEEQSSDVVCVRSFTTAEKPIEIKVIPARRRSSGLLLITSADGLVRLLDIQVRSFIFMPE